MEEAYKGKVKRELGRLAQKVPNLLRNAEDFDKMEQIGKGGFGEVYLAYHKQEKILCAFKLIYPERLKGRQFRRFIDEVATMAKCHSQFVLPLFGYIIEPPYAIVTPFMKGGTLTDAISNKNDPLTPTQLTKIAMGIALGMAHIHAQDIYHRDLKTGNVLLDDNKLPKICDFGIARIIKDEANTHKTQKIGTPIAMAPELFSSSNYTKAVDVYAYAILLYEMIFKIKPYKGIKITEFQRRVLINGERIALPASTPEGLRHIVTHAWRQDPAKRPSFLEIYKYFADGRAAFKGTDPTEISLFAERNRDEFLAIERLTRAKKRKEAALAFHTDSSYEAKDSTPTRPSPLSSSSSQPTEISKEKENSLKNSKEKENSEPTEISKEISTKKKRKNSKTKTRRKKLIEEPTPEVTNEIEEERMFVDQLSSYAESLTLKQFKPFSRSVSSFVAKHQSSFVLDRMIDAGLVLMRRSREMLLAVSESDFLAQIPAALVTNASALTDAVALLAVSAPGCLDERYAGLVEKSLAEDPSKTLTALSYPARDKSLSAEVKGLLSRRAADFIDADYQTALRYIIVLLSAESAAIQEFVKSNDIRTVEAALCALIELNTKTKTKIKTEVDPAHFASLIPKTKLSISYLLRNPEVATTPRIVDNLVSECYRNPAALEALAAVARANPGLIAANDRWFDLARVDPRGAFRVFLASFGNQAARSSLARSPRLPPFLRALVPDGGDFVLSALPSLLRRLGMSAAFVRALEASGFIRAYLERGLAENTAARNNNCLVLVDAVVRVEFSPGVLVFAERIVELLGSPELFRSALSVLLLLSFFPAAREALRPFELAEYFRRLKEFEEYRDISVSILKNIC